MSNKSRKIITAILIITVLMAMNATSAFAGYNDCPYKADHYSYDGEKVDLHNSITPDYSSNQFHVLSYYYCTNCGLAWDINDSYIPMSRMKEYDQQN